MNQSFSAKVDLYRQARIHRQEIADLFAERDRLWRESCAHDGLRVEKGGCVCFSETNPHTRPMDLICVRLAREIQAYCDNSSRHNLGLGSEFAR